MTEEVIQKVGENRIRILNPSVLLAVHISKRGEAHIIYWIIHVQLQDKATRLTAERKKRGKTIPEGLVSTEDIRSYRQQASHVVCTETQFTDILNTQL